jgi:phosphoribosyl-dephospho-CoA transferase
MTGLRRHALVRVSKAPLAGSDTDRVLSDRWHAAGRPFVVARGDSDPNVIALGFCAVDARRPELRPRRVAVRTDPRHVIDVAGPPRLDEVAGCPATRIGAAPLTRLAAAAAQEGLDIRVYGSWMWQAVTGEGHVRETSDLDVLVDVSGTRQADRAAAFLERQQTDLGLALDGELSFAGLGEVHWREYRHARAEVLVKSVGAMRLMPRSELRP